MLLNVYIVYRARKITKKDFKNTTIINAYMIIVLTILVILLLLKRFFFVEGELILYKNVASYFLYFLNCCSLTADPFHAKHFSCFDI